MQNRQQRFLTYVLAVACTGVLVLMAGISGFQRGGSGIERWLWVAASCLIVCTVHLLPGLMQGKPLRQNLPIWLVWVGGFVFVIFAHSQFFTLAELHAGQERVASQGQITINAPASSTPAVMGRSATQVATELSRATALLNRLPETKQDGQRLVITTLQQELKIAQAAEEQANRQKQNESEKISRLQNDPVAHRLGALLGVHPEMVMLFASLFMALVLELVAAILWRLALDSRPPIAKLPESLSQPLTATSTETKINPDNAGDAVTTLVVTPPLVTVTNAVSNTAPFVTVERYSGVTHASNEACFSPVLPTKSPPVTLENPVLISVENTVSIPVTPPATEDPIFPDLFAAMQRGELKPTVSAIRAFAKVGTERARNLREALLAQKGSVAEAS